jgi:hypothetical protein
MLVTRVADTPPTSTDEAPVRWREPPREPPETAPCTEE